MEIKKNDKLTVTIEDMGEDGSGIRSRRQP